MKQKTRILIYILIAVAVVIMGTLTILKNHQADSPATAQEHIDLGRIYLTELSYEKASLEFTEAIEIEPLNSDAYLGLAEAYAGMGDTEKAIDILEEGYDKTGDERLKDMLEELQPPEETTVTTVVTTEETTTVSTVAMAVVPDLLGLTEEEAIAACETAGLNYSVSYEYSDVVEKGYVVNQVIPVNASVAEGISVPFTVSRGVKVVTTATTTEATTTAPAEEFITIKDVKYSTDLTDLVLPDMDLTNEDIKDLYKMKNLTYLTLTYDDIDYDFNGIEHKYGSINDISVLKNLKRINSLWLGYNKISDISPLKNLIKLTMLDLENNQISDIKPLENLTNLFFLRLTDNQISDISPLKNLTRLDHLEIENNQISDISALKNLTNLYCLSLSNNQISDMSALKNLTNLKYLHLYGNQISDISALENLTNLLWLRLADNQISDISPLKGLTNLTRLDLTGNPIRDEDIKELKKALPNCKIEY